MILDGYLCVILHGCFRALTRKKCASSSFSSWITTSCGDIYAYPQDRDASTNEGSNAVAHTDILAANGRTDTEIAGGMRAVRTPIDGAEIALPKMYTAEEVRVMIAKGAKFEI